MNVDTSWNQLFVKEELSEEKISNFDIKKEVNEDETSLQMLHYGEEISVKELNSRDGEKAKMDKNLWVDVKEESIGETQSDEHIQFNLDITYPNLTDFGNNGRNGGVKRKRVNLTITQKLELIKKLESGVSVSQLCEEFGVKKQTVSDIRKNKEKLKSFALKYNVDAKTKNSSVGARKHMKMAQDKNLEEAVYKWYVQERSCGANVRGIEIRTAAIKLAKHMNIKTELSDGWLWRFCNRHGIGNRSTQGETARAPTDEILPFRKKLNEIIRNEGLILSQVYNGDKTGIFWRSLPKNTQVHKHETLTLGHKINKERISTLCCTNADGLHHLKLAVIGKSACPHVLKDIMYQLPVIYYSEKNACFNMDIFSDWFFKHFIPAVRKYQVDVLKFSPDNIKALLILNNVFAYPNNDKLVSNDGKIRCIFLPPIKTSHIQPIDQGVIVTFKRLYQRRYLDEILIVKEEDEDLVEDIRGQRLLQNIKNYNLKSAIFNLAASWKDIKISTFANGWKKLLYDIDPEVDFKGFEANDFLCILQIGGIKDVTEENVMDWLDESDSDPGYKVLTEEEIAEEVLAGEKVDDSSECEDKIVVNKPKLSLVRDSIDTVINYIDTSSDHDVQYYYEQLRLLREIIIRKQYQRETQTKLDSFFKSVAVSNSPPSAQSTISERRGDHHSSTDTE